MTKFNLRKKILKIRKQKNVHNIKLNFSKLLNLFDNENIKKKNIGGYYPVQFEIDDLNILEELEKKRFKISLPVIKKNYEMDFVEWSFKAPLQINHYGIPEPISKKINYPDVIFVPLVAYDKDLNRLGYGGGFYDRYIQKIEKKKNIIKIGLGSIFQKVKKVPINFYDQKLDYILTEKNILK